MDKKEQILDLYFNKHLKQKEIADIANTSQQYIFLKLLRKMEDTSKKKVLKNLLTKKENEEINSSSLNNN